jgi:hypothetical protein
MGSSKQGHGSVEARSLIRHCETPLFKSKLKFEEQDRQPKFLTSGVVR